MSILFVNLLIKKKKILILAAFFQLGLNKVESVYI